MNELIQLNEPIVEAFAAGHALRADELQEGQSRIEDVLDELESLRPPPKELESAYTSVFESATEFGRAFKIASAELMEGSGSPFSAAFLEAAHRGGEAVHRSAWALQVHPGRGLCIFSPDVLVTSG